VTVECAAYVLFFTLMQSGGCDARRFAAEESGVVVLASPGDPRRYAALSVIFRQAGQPAAANAAVFESPWNRQSEPNSPQWASRSTFLVGDDAVTPKLKWATDGGELALTPRRHSIRLEWKLPLR
jgi:hypothetical protein